MTHPTWLAWLGGADTAMSAVALCADAADKSAARRGRRRIRQSTLHTIALLGGWPGALVAQHLFRHKRRKWSFVLLTWLSTIAHAGAVMFLVMRR